MGGGMYLARYFRHWWAEDRRKALDDAALQRLGRWIHDSEQHHSGEIRICVEARLPTRYLLRPHAMLRITRERAIAQFGKLRVWDTEDNNGVLIYLLLAERAIEIVADRGICRHVHADVWLQITQTLSAHLQRGQYEEGLAQCLKQVDALLVRHFPVAPGSDNPNELPDMPHAC